MGKVCLLNITGYQCKCEGQYSWPCTKCTANTNCDGIINATCRCINDIPSDGQFCQPVTELANVDECARVDEVCGPNAMCSNGIGNYSCTCLKGYNVTNPFLLINISNPCRDVDECARVDEVCGPNAMCSNGIGNYSCTCLNGYNVTNPFLPINISNPCRDVDECARVDEVCGPNAMCSNAIGNYSCTCLNGYNVTNPFLLINISNPCRDVDECARVDEVCGPNAMCSNGIGNYSCTCLNGYNVTNPFLPINISNPCRDVDECARVDEVCGPNAMCSNAIGNYSCTCLNGYNVTNPFLLINISNPCRDVDECVRVDEVCGPNAMCSNGIGNYSCTCINGYNVANPFLPINISNPCRDVDECARVDEVCGPNAMCSNGIGNYSCTCLNGYNVTNPFLSINISNPCRDVDECARVDEVCGPNAMCSNGIGNYSCTCLNGYNVTNPFLSINISNPCRDVDECVRVDEVCGPNAMCSNGIGNYSCTCLNGYNVANPFLPINISNPCRDVDECARVDEVCGPNAMCSNGIGNYSCTCLNGYNVANPFLLINISNPCRDVDECARVDEVCGPNAVCSNGIGNYSCTCLNGYNVTNPFLPINISNPCRGVDECARVDEVCGPNAMCSNGIGNYSCTCLNGYNVTNPFLPINISNPCRGTSTPNTTSEGTSTPSPVVPSEISRTISMRIDEEFDSTLTNTLSEKYKSHSSIIISSVDSVYQSTLSSYKAGSVTITQFRPGSVISDFRIVTTSNTLDFSKANAQLASALTANGLLVSANSFAQTEENTLYDLKNGKIYPGRIMVLTCKTPDPKIQITWSMNDIIIKPSAKYQISTDNKTLTVTSTSDQDNGKYACTMTFNSMPYISFQKMSIQPSPEVNVNTSKTLLCDGSPIRLQCCAESSYTIQWSLNTATGQQSLTDQKTICNTYTQNINKTECEKNDKILTFTCEIRENNGSLHSSVPVTITVTSKSFNCFNAQFGAGNYNDIKPGACDANSVGNVTARCMLNPTTNKYDWEIVENNCVLRVLQDLLNRAKFLRAEDVPSFLGEILNATKANADEITRSTVNIVAVVGLLNSTSNVSQSFRVDQSIMRNFLKTVDVIGSINARNTWLQLNKHNTTEQTSSLLLKSTEDMGKTLTNESFSITTNTTQLSRTSTNGPFFGTFGINSTTQIAIPMFNGTTLITTIVFSLFNTVLPVRNTTYNHSQTDTSINADVAAVIVEKPVHNISLTFDVQNNLLGSPQCVFWNFSLLNGIGGWDSTGCEIMPVVNHTDKFTCKCNHTTSFSILMSPFKSNNLVLAFITYIGVGISLICLIVCFIIEGIIWKPMTRNDTSYMRHVSIVNIALSLLIADICFIIGAAIVKEGEPTPEGSCSTATFFMHFFYLALFFWMLFSAFLLLYRTVVVFAGMSRTKMMVIAFTVGYGAPLLIAVITVAVTAGGKGYVQEDSACWLNWKKTKAILAFVIPALTIVAINFLVLLVVLCKMLKRGVGATTQPDEKHTIVVIARCVAILTPLFGLTWGFGIGTMVSSALGLHIVFAILNSLQGFFILVFAVLLDSKIREELAGKLSLRNISSNRTRSTSTGPSSSSGQGFFDRFRRRNVYHVADSSGIAAASSSHSDTFVNT
ncbi:uncharacterized protein [Salminus brasiliensis]|uniref:uncharacterized protein n=1 Tax=Salminus brasiliensis TaxID=930266 RepID=UPI003B82F919